MSEAAVRACCCSARSRPPLSTPALEPSLALGGAAGVPRAARGSRPREPLVLLPPLGARSMDSMPAAAGRRGASSLPPRAGGGRAGSPWSPWTIRDTDVFDPLGPGRQPVRLHARRHLQRPAPGSTRTTRLMARRSAGPAEPGISAHGSSDPGEPEAKDYLQQARGRRSTSAGTRATWPPVRLVDDAAHARPRRLRLVAPHRLDDQRRARAGRTPGVFCFRPSPCSRWWTRRSRSRRAGRRSSSR